MILSKNSHLKELFKFFCVFILIMHILFYLTNQKNVLQKEIKDWTSKIYLLTGECSSWFQFSNSSFLIIETDLCQLFVWFFNFLLNGGLDCFSRPNALPKLSKITATFPKSPKWTGKVSFNLPNISKMNVNFELLKVSKMISLKISHEEARNIKFWQQVNLIIITS